MVRNLQIWHIVWLALTPILFALLRLSSEHHDAARALVDNLVTLGAAGWASCVAIYFIFTGKRGEALPDLLKVYRGLLHVQWFLLISNIAGSMLVLVIAYNLAMYRQIEFLSPVDAELLLNDYPGELAFIGFVKAKTPTYFRLRLGSRKLVFRETATNKVFGQVTLDVPSLIGSPARVRSVLEYRKGMEYEKAE